MELGFGAFHQAGRNAIETVAVRTIAICQLFDEPLYRQSRGAQREGYTGLTCYGLCCGSDENCEIQPALASNFGTPNYGDDASVIYTLLN